MKDRVIKSEKIDWKQIKTLQPDNFKMPEQQEVFKQRFCYEFLLAFTDIAL